LLKNFSARKIQAVHWHRRNERIAWDIDGAEPEKNPRPRGFRTASRM